MNRPMPITPEESERAADGVGSATEATTVTRKEFIGTAAKAAIGVAVVGAGIGNAPALAASARSRSPQLMRAGSQVTLTWLINATPAELLMRKAVLAKFEAANPDIKVDLQIGGNGFFQKLNTQIAGGTPPDLILAFELEQPDYEKRGVFMQLDPFFAHDNEFQTNVMAQQYPTVLEMFKYQGHVYAMPEAVNNVVLYYNRNHVKAAGLTMPSSWDDSTWTWEKFLDYANKLTQKSGSRVVRHGYTEMWSWPIVASNVIAAANGGAWFKQSVNPPTGSSNLADPNIAQAVQFYADLTNVHKVAPSNADLASMSGNGTPLFQSGRASMGIAGHWTYKDFALAGIPFDIAPIPIGPSGGSHSATGLGGIGLAMSAKTKYPEQCWRLIKYWTGVEGESQFAASGLWVPTLKNIGQSAAYMKANAAAPHPGVYPEVLKKGYVHSLPISRAWPEFVTPYATTMVDQIWSGKQTASSALPGLDKTVNADIQKYG